MHEKVIPRSFIDFQLQLTSSQVVAIKREVICWNRIISFNSFQPFEEN